MLQLVPFVHQAYLGSAGDGEVVSPRSDDVANNVYVAQQAGPVVACLGDGLRTSKVYIYGFYTRMALYEFSCFEHNLGIIPCKLYNKVSRLFFALPIKQQPIHFLAAVGFVELILMIDWVILIKLRVCMCDRERVCV